MDSTLLKGLTVLERVAASDEPRGVTELAEELPLTKSNAHRILKTLEAAGYLTRDQATRRYKLTLKLWELGLRVVSRMDIRVQAAAWMKELAAATRETVHLSVLDGHEVIYIDKVDSSEPIQAYSQVGGRAPAHCVATGKALLAWAPDSLINTLTDRLERFSEHTITDPAQFHAELERIRKQGYALNLGEWRDSVWGVAAVIRDARGDVAGAIGISGPSYRLEQLGVEHYTGPVMQAAADISARLGYREHLVPRSVAARGQGG